MADEPLRFPDRMPEGSVGPKRRRLRYRILDLGPVHGNHNMIHAINNAGQVVGSALTGGDTVQAFVSNGAKRPLGTLGGAFSVARDINNSGQIVGGSLTVGNEQFHAFLFTGQAMYDLNQLIAKPHGWELVQALGINDHGHIVGIGMLEGEDHVFVLRPEHCPPGGIRSRGGTSFDNGSS